jgi:hypothetical protein
MLILFLNPRSEHVHETLILQTWLEDALLVNDVDSIHACTTCPSYFLVERIHYIYIIEYHVVFASLFTKSMTSFVSH